jgi:hypothetical protein
MSRLAQGIFVTALVLMPLQAAFAGSSDERRGQQDAPPKLLERRSAENPPRVNALATPAALAQWLNDHRKDRLAIDIRIAR